MTITAQEILAQRLYHQALLESKLTGTEVLAKSLGIQSQYVTHGIYNYSTVWLIPRRIAMRT